MKKSTAAKIIAAVAAAVIVVAGCVAFLVDVKTESLGTPAFCVSMDENGSYKGKAESFAGDVEQIVFACKNNKFYVKEATITWYSDSDNINPVKTEIVSANKAGYFVSTFSKAEGLAAGEYHAYIDVNTISGVSKSVANFTVQ